ncbi:MAG: glycoside hydrolase family 57 protein [Steroidobacteraceae bacterium]
MTAATRLPVVLLWHMHQPHYRDALSGQYEFPWTYLHAIKDYVDMVGHLEANPKARAVVNFTPVLIEQLEELALRVNLHLTSDEELPDPILKMISSEPLPTLPAQRLTLLRACLRAERQNLIGRYPAFEELAALAASLGTLEYIGYASDQFLRDLAVWYHIAWLGETVRRSDPRVAALVERARHFDAGHRRSLLQLIGELLANLLPRYRALLEAGRCELSVTPYSHPIVPLLLDFNAARECVPASPLPKHDSYPGGFERANWQMEEALRVFRRVFGRAPSGCWPSEGAISARTLEVIDQGGIEWVASSANVLRAGLNAGNQLHGEEDALFNQAFRPEQRRLSCYFRHDTLSDLIGFTYSKWHGDDAARHMVNELVRLESRTRQQPGRVVLIALDGENAWEYYPFNGYYFLNALYAALADHPQLELTTLGDCTRAARERGVQPFPLRQVVAGSWVHGTLETWIGDRAKNAGWDRLCEAKLAFDQVMQGASLTQVQRAVAERQLALCESSDWFWWLGDYNPPEAVADFDRLFRHQLTNLYHLLKLDPPATLAAVICVGHGAPESGGVMRRA